MTTATKTRPTTKSPSAQLADLNRAAEQAQAEARAARRKVEAYDQETEAMRPHLSAHLQAHPEEAEGTEQRVKPGTEAARIDAEVRKRLREPNPYQAEYEAARDEFHERDLPRQAFKRERVLDRIAELKPDAVAAEQAIREALDLLRQGCEQYEGVAQATAPIVQDTPGLDHRSLDQDPRPAEWHRQTSAVLATDVRPPGLTDNGRVKAATFAEAAREKSVENV